MTERLVLALFVTPENRHRAMANLSLALETASHKTSHIFECDVREYPEVAETMLILATPCLIRFWPLPRLDIIGDLSDIKHVRELLFGVSATKPVLVHNLYARQDVRHEEIADRLRAAQSGQWRQLTAEQQEFPFSVMEDFGIWARKRVGA
jgi:circadian clock protein KaiB